MIERPLTFELKKIDNIDDIDPHILVSWAMGFATGSPINYPTFDSRDVGVDCHQTRKHILKIAQRHESVHYNSYKIKTVVHSIGVIALIIAHQELMTTFLCVMFLVLTVLHEAVNAVYYEYLKEKT